MDVIPIRRTWSLSATALEIISSAAFAGSAYGRQPPLSGRRLSLWPGLPVRNHQVRVRTLAGSVTRTTNIRSTHMAWQLWTKLSKYGKIWKMTEDGMLKPSRTATFSQKFLKILLCRKDIRICVKQYIYSRLEYDKQINTPMKKKSVGNIRWNVVGLSMMTNFHFIFHTSLEVWLTRPLGKRMS